MRPTVELRNRNQKREARELVSLLRQLSSYVFARNGDMTKLLSSGFPRRNKSLSDRAIAAPGLGPLARTVTAR